MIANCYLPFIHSDRDIVNEESSALMAFTSILSFKDVTMLWLSLFFT